MFDPHRRYQTCFILQRIAGNLSPLQRASSKTLRASDHAMFENQLILELSTHAKSRFSKLDLAAPVFGRFRNPVYFSTHDCKRCLTEHVDMRGSWD